MKNIGVCVNLEKDANFLVTKNIISIANKLGVNCEVATKEKKYDFIISLGGDGTFLSTSRKFYNNKIIGVNLGNLGFLAELDKDNIEAGLRAILDGDFTVEKRFFLETIIHDKLQLALNDIVISKGVAKLLSLKLYFNNKFVDTYVTDGIIISTPTGSTAYSLSAGGPLVEPKVEVLIITPVCPHSLHQRAIVVPMDTEVKIVSDTENFLISADGQEPISSENVKELLIRRSNKNIEIIKIAGDNFFDVVRNKFHIN